ncbi:hypothetical protein [uncultured Aquimarina sp.]|uniref:hypothetical protein n=1 Tax=uncultured Aquimarina sp. TaxID=575652 RepID=UPI002603DAE2|nr:hypothetical protein [uncultured Aquimarina sp.]
MKKLSLLLLMSIVILSCSKTESTGDEYVSLEKTTYEIADDTFITVLLDPTLEVESHSFTSLDEHDDYVDQLEDSSNQTITLNKKMYEDLSHYFDPFQIAVFNKNYSVEIGDKVFKATKEAIYKKSKNRNDWELHLYYGLSGKEDLKETELVYKNSNDLSKLKDYDFKSPTSKKVYERKLEEGFAKGKNTQYFNYPEVVRYKETQFGNIQTARIRWKCWNEEYVNVFATKAKGGTLTEINRASRGWQPMRDDGKIGDYLETGEHDRSTGRVSVEIKTSKGTGEADVWKRNVSKDKVKRKKKTNATSFHFGWIRDNITGEPNTGMRDFWLN